VSQVNARRIRMLVMGLVAASLLTGCGLHTNIPPLDPDTTGSTGNGFSQVPQLPTGTVTGRVVDSRTGLGVPGVQITLIGAATTTQHTVVTNGAGEFTLSQVPAAKQKLSLFKQGYTYLSSNGDVIVDVLAGSTVTTPDIKLTQSLDALTNAFSAAFSDVRLPQHLAYDSVNGYIYTVSKTNWNLGSVPTPKELWQVNRFDTKGGLLASFGASFDWLLNEYQHIFQPMGMACDTGGNLYLCDPIGTISPQNPIKRYDLQGNITVPNANFQTFPGVGQPYDIKAMRDGFAIINKSGNLLIESSGRQLIKQIPISPAVTSIAVDANDNIYVVDNGSQTAVIKKYDPNSPTYQQPVLFFGSLNGRGASQFQNPTDIAVDNRNGDFYVCDSGNNRVVRFSSQGTYLSEFGGMGAAQGQFNHPTGIVVDKDGYVYVSDTNNNRIQKFTPSPLRPVGQTP